MVFRLELPKINYDFNINHQNKICFIGSCFSEEIYNKMNQHRFKVKQNPFGILFHTLAIEDCLNRIINKIYFKESDIIQNKNIFFSWEVHSLFSSENKHNIIKKLNLIIDEFYNFIKNSSHLFITLGTSFVYELIENNKIVANCHKIPNNKFVKKLLSENQTIKSLTSIIEIVKKINSECKVIFTISPVRHIKDGIFENNVSKSKLLGSIYEICNIQKKAYYFPSYELILDDLRDYRFFKDDLIHPNPFAIEYVWKYFEDSFFSSQTKNINIEINKINKALNHKPYFPDSEEYKIFIEKIKNKELKLGLID